MEFPLPDEFKLDGVSTQVVADAAELARRVNDLRPIAQEVMARVERDLLGERVYNSNSIEGNQLTLRETQLVLNASDKIDVGRKRDATEALNLAKAIARVQEAVEKRALWSDEEFFLDVHRLLLAEINDDYAGRFRDERVRIRGAIYQPPNVDRMHDLLGQFFTALGKAKAVEPVRLAIWTHWAIARIHPFFDGNGRMSRLWQDLILFGNGYTAAMIRATERDRYYKSLAAADDGDLNPLAQLVARAVSDSLQVYLNAQREADDLSDWAAEIVGELDARDDESRTLEYTRWARVMEQLRDAFQRCAALVTSHSNGNVEIQVAPFDIIEQPTWESLRSGSGAARTWFFWVNFRRGNRRINYCFFFGHHSATPADSKVSTGIGPNAGLLISEQQGTDESVRLDQIPDSPLSLREFLAVEGKLLRKRLDISSDEVAYDQNADAVSVAREFISDVLLRRLK